MIRIAGNYVDATDFLVGSVDDDIAYGHLQIVFDPGNGEDLLEIEAQSPWNITLGHWQVQASGRSHTNSDNTPHYGQDDLYSSVLVDLGHREATDVWSILEQARQQFDAASNGIRFEYDLEYNSNTFVNTLLKIVDVDLNNILSTLTTDNIFSYPGFDRNALNDAEYPNDAIDLKLVGGERIDHIRTGNGDDTLIGSQLGATLEGQDNADHAADRLEGGKGDDTYYVSADGLYFFGAADQPQPEPLLDNLDIIHDSDDTGTVYAQMHGNVTGNPFTRAYTSLNMY